jgi:hypothetical protein
VPITLLNAAAAVGNNTTSVPITVGASPTAGDLRIVRVECATSRTLSTPSGWTALYNSTSDAVSRRVAIFYRVLTGSDTDTTATMSSSGGWGTASITIRGRDTAQTLASTTTGSSSNSSNLVAPSISVSGPGVLLTWHDITDTTSGAANTSTQTVPAGMTRLAYTASDSTAGFNIGLNYEVETADGTTGTRTAVSSTTGTWSGTSMFIADGLVSKAGGDSGSGAESGAAVAGPAGADTATGAEAGVAAILFAGADTATGSEAGNAGNGGSGTDTALGTDTGTAATATVGGDSGTGIDPTTTPITVAPTTGDTATGGETGQTATATTGADTATGTNLPGSSTAAVTGTNPGTGTETGSTTAQVTGTDQSNTTETGKITTYGADTATGASTLTNLYADTRGTDSGTGADGGYVEALDGDIVISIYALVAGVAVPLPDYQSLTLAPTRNGAGSISLTYPAAGLNFSVLRDNTVGADRDLEVEIWTIGNPTGALRGYLQEGSGDDVKEGRGGSWTFTGGFLELRMAEARVWPQPLVGEATLGDTVTVKKSTVTAAQWTRLTATLGYNASSDADPTVSVPQKILDAVKANAATVPVLADPKREAKFIAQTPGAMISFLLAQARARGALTDITTSFTAERDSNGTPWPTLVTTTVSPGATYEQVLNLLAQLGRAEWSMSWTGTARQLNLWIAGARGVDKSTGLRPVVLRAGRNLPEAPTKWSVRSSPTAMGAAGAEGWYADTTDLNAQARRGRRIEGWTTSQNLQTSDAVLAYAQRRLSTNSDGTLEVTHGLALLPGQPRPLISFNVGDWIYSATGTSLDRYRVVEWSLTINATRQMSATVTLNDAFVDEVLRQRQQLDAISSGEAVTGTSTRPVDATPPSPPTGLLVSSGAFNEGIDAYAVVLVGWTAPETNVDGSALTSLAGYRVEWTEYANPTKWRAAATVGGNVTQAQFTTAVGLPILVRVSAYKASGAASAWLTLTAPHTTEVDSTPPPQTSAIIGSVYLGVVTWTWDGKSSTGADMFAAAPDFDFAELHMSTSSQFTPDSSTQLDKVYGKGAYSYAKMPDGSPIGYGVTVYARLVPVDVRGNRQPTASVQGSAVPAKLLGDDVFAGAIGSAQLADASVIRAKIGVLAVGDGQIENLGVGKLTAGLLTASMIIGTGKIATAASGARVEQDSAGLRLYDSGGNINVQFKTSDGSAMIAGEYRTSLTSGQRLVFNPNGSAPDEVRFYPGSTNQYASMTCVTSVAIGNENQAGINMKGYSPRQDKQSGEVAVFPGYASIAWANERGGGAVTSRVSASSGEVYIGGPRARVVALATQAADYRGFLSVGPDRDNNGEGLGWGSNPGVLSFTTSNGNGTGNARFRNFDRNSGFQFDTGIISVVQTSGAAARFQAATHEVSSSRTRKHHVERVPFDPLTAIRRAPAHMWEYLDTGTGKHIGPMIEDLPAVMRRRNDDQDLDTVDLGALIGVLWAVCPDLASRIERLEAAVHSTPPLKAVS